MVARGKQSDTSKIPQWQFREMQPGEINVDPIEGEFFTTEALTSVTDALVRESVQNSLDAAQEKGPVTVRFSFHSRASFGSHEKTVLRTYLDGLHPHIEARHSGLQDPPSSTESLNHILIEDYGTRGLQGDVLQYDDLDDDVKRNDFYYFWRNIGRTRKGDTDLGRWGLGKTVFQAASRINSFFGMTVRHDDGQMMLMGQSVLKIHKVDGSRYAPYGYFGLFDGDLALPIQDQKYLETFAKRFSIDRSGKPGLTILVPYPDKELNARNCALSVIRHYFFPILAGELIIELAFNGKKLPLDAESLDRFLKKSRLPERIGLLGLSNLARWAIHQPEKSFIQLSEPTIGKAPKLREDLFAKKDLEDIRQRFSEGERLAFNVPITIQRHNSREIMRTGFKVFLERDDSLEKAEDHFIRQGITIPEVSSLRHKGIRAIVSITDRDLSTFLGDAENPAHTQWERNSKKFKKKYRLGVSTLDFVKSSPREIVKVLTQPKKGRDENLLRHLFALPQEPSGDSGKEQKKKKGQGEDKGTDGTPIQVKGAKYLQLNAIKGGFSLRKKAKAKQVPKLITVEMAYEVRSGNPFKKYTPLDFDVSKSPIQITLVGAELLLSKENTIQIDVETSSFKLAVIGFDPHRDLRVKTKP